MQCLLRNSVHLLVDRMEHPLAAVELATHHRTYQAVDMREYIFLLRKKFQKTFLKITCFGTAVTITQTIRMKLPQQAQQWAAVRWICRMLQHHRIHAIAITSAMFKKWLQQTLALQAAQAPMLHQVQIHQVLPAVQAQANSDFHWIQYFH